MKLPFSKTETKTIEKALTLLYSIGIVVKTIEKKGRIIIIEQEK